MSLIEGPMNWTMKPSTTDSGIRMGKEKEKGSKSGKMVASLLDIGKMTWPMVKED